MSETVNDIQMSPDASPGNISKKTGVRRANNLPIYLIGATAFVFLLLMALVASERSSQQFEESQINSTKKKTGNSKVFADELTKKYGTGIIPANKPKPEPKIEKVKDLSMPPEPPMLVGIARPQHQNLPPPMPPNPKDAMLEEEKNRIRQIKMQQFIEATKAKSGVQFEDLSASSNGGFSGGTPTTRNEVLDRIASVQRKISSAQSDDPTVAYKQRLQQMKAAGLLANSTTSDNTPPTLLNFGNSKQNGSIENQGSDRWKLDTQLEAPQSAYEIRSGFVIPGTMISGINSDLPGQITAQVSQNVFDTATGKYMLIPQGSRLVGRYSNDVAFGQERVLIAWQRIIFPDGKALDIGNMPGADSAGYSGFNDLVNNHYFKIFGSALLMSAVTAGISLSQERDNDFGDRITASQAMSEALGQQLGQVTAQLIAKNMNIAPTLEIRPGYRFNIIVTKDMVFSKPYQGFDYQL